VVQLCTSFEKLNLSGLISFGYTLAVLNVGKIWWCRMIFIYSVILDYHFQKVHFVID
jgi:hypothetical protein